MTRDELEEEIVTLRTELDQARRLNRAEHELNRALSADLLRTTDEIRELKNRVGAVLARVRA